MSRASISGTGRPASAPRAFEGRVFIVTPSTFSYWTGGGLDGRLLALGAGRAVREDNVSCRSRERAVEVVGRLGMPKSGDQGRL